MTKTTTGVEEAKKQLRRKPLGTFSKEDLLSTGSTLLNLASTGHWEGGFAKGMYFSLVGDSASGKTFLSLTCLAEAARNPSFKDYRFIFDDVEGGALMDVEKFFGPKVAERLEPPARYEDGEPCFSETVEEFYFNLDDALDTDVPCIYIIDSMDALSSKSEGAKFGELKDATRAGKKVAGDYGDGKAKVNARYIRSMLAKLRDTGSILIMISQTRDNVGGGIFEPRKIRSGGHALRFYATVEAWSSIAGQIKKSYQSKDRQIGVNCRVKISKNRFTGRLRTVTVPILHSFGIDDVGSCIDYLVSEKRWDRKGQTIDASDWELRITRAKLIEHVEEKGLEAELSQLVAETWNDIEEAVSENRKSRYS